MLTERLKTSGSSFFEKLLSVDYFLQKLKDYGTDKVTGRAQYGADFTIPRVLYGKILRSPHAHARIKSIDTTKVEALPGVLSVATHADFHSGKGSICLLYTSDAADE